jgi:hypothetical protein
MVLLVHILAGLAGLVAGFIASRVMNGAPLNGC